MQRLRRPLGALGLVLLLVAGARAEETATPAPSRPCAADIDRFCKGAPARDGRIRACLDAHAAELSAPCRARLQAMPAANGGRPAMDVQQFVACRADLQAHCAGVPSGGGRLRACLDAHATELSARCKALLTRQPDAAVAK